jgi:NAD(P)-dependent dehydrogenase (short-subunit alcohol dehydrogenase family)
MDLGLEGKVVLITGGSKGIGLACARAFAAEGAKVAIASRSPDNLKAARDELAKEHIGVFTFSADLTNPDEAKSMAAAVEKNLGPIDVLVNSAGAAKRHALDEYDAHAWHQGMDAKYYPYINAMDAVRAGMLARKRGSIVNIIGAGGKRGQPTHLAGGAANAALMLVTVGMAHALGKSGIRVNAINPGSTYTGRVQQALRLDAKEGNISEAEALKRREAEIPLQRYGKPEEVAAVTVFLASEQASYVTAAVIPMDGGSLPVI